MSKKHLRISILWKIIFATVITHLGNTTCTINPLYFSEHTSAENATGTWVARYLQLSETEVNTNVASGLFDIELTYIGNDSYLSDCGTSTGDDVDAWCDD